MFTLGADVVGLSVGTVPLESLDVASLSNADIDVLYVDASLCHAVDEELGRNLLDG